jgi:hypothetical protein
MKRALLALPFVAACAGETGTLSVSLTTAPGSTLLDSVQTLRMTVTNPRQVITAERTASGFAIGLELDATGETTELLVEGLDASGNLVANGASPEFPIGAINGRILIYMAPPLSVGEAPLSLTPARSELAAAPLPYGIVFAGGRLESGAASDAVTIYNAFDHSMLGGLPLPAPRAGIALTVGAAAIAYLFGGSDDAGIAHADLWRFDTKTPPAGSYAEFGAKEGFARANQIMLPIGGERYLISGTPAAELTSLTGAVVARDEVPSLPPAGTTLTADDGMLATIFAGPDGVLRFRSGMFTTLDIPSAARADVKVVALPGGDAVVVCGTAEAVRIDAATGAAESLPGIPSVAKTGCAAAATPRHLIIAGGDAAGTIDGTVEIYDAATLARLATAPLVVPRKDAIAIALPNGQILIAGGVDAGGDPISTLELFTPPLP